MVRRLLPLCLVLGTGCASAPPIMVGRPVEVRVPIYEPAYCAVTIPGRPALPIAGLRPDSNPAAEVKAYAASVALLKAAVLEREDLLAACVKPTGEREARTATNCDAARRRSIRPRLADSAAPCARSGAIAPAPVSTAPPGLGEAKNQSAGEDGSVAQVDSAGQEKKLRRRLSALGLRRRGSEPGVSQE